MATTKLLLCQLSVTQLVNLKREWVEFAEVKAQLAKCHELIVERKPDITVMPETCYFPHFETFYTTMSVGRLIVAGSRYNEDGVNETHVFCDGKHTALRKLFPSPKEVMENNHPNCNRPDMLFSEWENEVRQGHWPDYFVLLPGTDQVVAILNCMDYYRLGYYVANSSVIAPKLWGIVSPCSNGQQDIFVRLSQAIHDSSSRIYSIVVNSANASRHDDSSQGESYVYGPVTRNIKAHLAKMHRWDEKHPAAICHLKASRQAQALLMDLLPPRKVEFFARDSSFRSNPINVELIDGIGGAQDES